MTNVHQIRDALPSDIDALVDFTLNEAREAEGIELSIDDVRRGVAAAFADPPRAKYWVAEFDGALVANISVVTEWSNFHGGDYWWVQSLFIVPEHRGRGLVENLLERVSRAAGEAGALELRLYASSSNERAIRAYSRCGFDTATYTIMTRRL